MTTAQQILDEVQRLDAVQQGRVLAFARSLSQPNQLPKGTSVDVLMQFAGAIPLEDLQEMAMAIEEGCEKVDPNEW